MTVEPFDNRYLVQGSYRVYKKSDNSLFSNNPTSSLQGSSGTNDSISHPYPYTTGGPWTLIRTQSCYGLLSGTLDPWSTGYRAIYDQYQFGAPIGNGTNATLVGSTTVNEVLASTNPSRPSIDLPYFFGELGEIPRLLYKQGKNMVDSTARANLSSEFGWELIIPDLRSIMTFQAALNRRVRHLSNGFHSGGFRFERELAKGSYRNPPVISSLAAPAKRRITVTHGESRQWCSVSWRPVEDVAIGIPSPNEIRRRAFDAVTGNRVDAGLVWNLLPWTWLIDWFVHVGSFLQARSNLVGFVPGTGYVMTHHKRATDHYHELSPNFKGTMIEPVYIRESKARTPVGTTGLSASMPIVTKRQLGILASLAVLKFL